MDSLIFEPGRRFVEDALVESAGLLALAEDAEKPALSAWVLEGGPAIVLGALQRAGRVLERVPAAGYELARRASSGTHVRLDGGLLVSVALPSIDAVFDDARPSNSLNRNVRLFLAGFAGAGVPCHSFGREWIAWRRRPIAVCGIDGTPSGAMLFELLATERGGLELERSITTDTERSTDRYRGKTTASLVEALGDRDRVEAARSIVDAIVARIGGNAGRAAVRLGSIETAVRGGDSPLPAGARVAPPVPVPIGWLDVARTDVGAWVGGDVLAPTYALGHGGPIDFDLVPLEGATWGDVERARSLPVD